MISWDVYELSSEHHALTGVKMRGRIRKFGLQEGINLLTENTEEVEGRVRFAVESGSSIEKIKVFLENIIPDIVIEKKLEHIKNPVLSKLKINKEERYEI